MIRAGTTVKKTTGPMTNGAKKRKVGAKKRSGDLALILGNPSHVR